MRLSDIPRNIEAIPSRIYTVAIAVFIMLYALAGPVVAYLMSGGK
jgi:hypothetical protein